jgi:hypothetical protein
MPFKSQAQRRKFAGLLVEGKISGDTFEEWNRETGSKRLPERATPRKGRKKGAGDRVGVPAGLSRLPVTDARTAFGRSNRYCRLAGTTMVSMVASVRSARRSAASRSAPVSGTSRRVLPSRFTSRRKY